MKTGFLYVKTFLKTMLLFNKNNFLLNPDMRNTFVNYYSSNPTFETSIVLKIFQISEHFHKSRYHNIFRLMNVLYILSANT